MPSSSNPNKVSSKLSESEFEQFTIVKGNEFLEEVLCITLAAASLPLPASPESITLAFELDTFSNCECIDLNAEL